MIRLQLESITKYYGDKLILDKINLSASDGDKIGIIGSNGAGKSTILNIISSAISADEGKIHLGKNSSIGYQKQIEKNLNLTIFDYCLETYNDIFELENKIKDLNNMIAKDHDNEILYKRLEQLNIEFENKKGYEAWSRIKGILFGLDFKEEDFDRQINSLSGGELTKLSIAKLLSRDYDILLLDEPTNHLEIEAINWLSNHLKSYKGTIIFVTHDRFFLDTISNVIIEISNAKLTKYHGNYADYKKKKKEIDNARLEEYNRYLERIKKEKQILLEFKQRSKVNDKFAARAKDREKKIEKIEVVDKPLIYQDKMRVSFKSTKRSGDDVLELKNITKSYDKCVLDDINLKVFSGDRIAIIGGNGSGKSTLLKIINNLIKYEGEVKYGTNVIPAYYDQHQKYLNDNFNLVEQINDEFPKYNHSMIRNMLANFLFKEDDVFKKISSLSGGERARLALFKLSLEDNNLLILDEPTNHLDISSTEVLEEALSKYDGTIIFVSHDRYFINSLANKILKIQDGKINVSSGNYDDFINKSKKKKYKKKYVNKREKQKKSKTPEELEELIHSAEREYEEITLELNKEEVYSDKQKVKDCLYKQEKLGRYIEELYNEWGKEE